MIILEEVSGFSVAQNESTEVNGGNLSARDELTKKPVSAGETGF
jgi:hypothetical protein